jgi:hypothetical protein
MAYVGGALALVGVAVSRRKPSAPRAERARNRTEIEVREVETQRD